MDPSVSPGESDGGVEDAHRQDGGTEDAGADDDCSDGECVPILFEPFVAGIEVPDGGACPPGFDKGPSVVLHHGLDGGAGYAGCTSAGSC